MNMRINLKIFRVKNLMSQSEMAARLDYSCSQYSNVERGERDGTQEFWNKLQSVFDVPDEEMWKLMKKEQ